MRKLVAYRCSSWPIGFLRSDNLLVLIPFSLSLSLYPSSLSLYPFLSIPSSLFLIPPSLSLSFISIYLSFPLSLLPSFPLFLFLSFPLSPFPFPLPPYFLSFSFLHLSQSISLPSFLIYLFPSSLPFSLFISFPRPSLFLSLSIEIKTYLNNIYFSKKIPKNREKKYTYM